MQNKIYELIAKIQQYLIGRNGIDSLNKALIIAYLAFSILNSLLFRYISSGIFVLFRLVSISIFAIVLYRFLSKDLSKRRKENEDWLLLYARLQKDYGVYRKQWNERKTYKYIKCSRCKAQIRVKRVKGKHRIDCPKCGKEIKIKI